MNSLFKDTKYRDIKQVRIKKLLKEPVQLRKHTNKNYLLVQNLESVPAAMLP